MIGAVVHSRFLYPNTGRVLVDGGTQTISNSTVFDFGITTVSFSDTQITGTNASSGAFNSTAFNGIDLAFLSGPTITSVTEDASSSLLFAPGSVLTFTGNDIMLNLAGTCNGCVGGEQIILNVTTATAIPEPAAMAVLGVGLLGSA